MKSSYDAKDIAVLEGLEPVRKRPGMYIGTTGPDGLHHLITEVFDNSRDEAMAGFANEIEIALLPDNYVRVVDNGRGIPVDTHAKTKVSALETIMTTLHAGGKFEGKGYKVSGGLHGVGVSVVNALSEDTCVRVMRGGSEYTQSYAFGKPVNKIKKIGASKYIGTIVTFKPDITIFKEIEFNFDTVVSHLRRQAYLVSSLKIRVIDARELKNTAICEKEFYIKNCIEEMPSYTFYFEGGIQSLVRFYNNPHEKVHDSVFYVNKKDKDNEVEVALQYVDDISHRVHPFANNIHTPEGGTHITGFKTALTRIMNIYAKENELVKDAVFTSEDTWEGLTAVISVKLPEIQFEGQTKAKLGSVEARSMVETIFGDALKVFLEENPAEARSIIKKIALAFEARRAAKSAKDSVLRKGALEGFTLPGKLADCQTKSPEESEIFIVEGDSAGGTAKAGRDRRTQAILPLRGKILNVEKKRLHQILESESITSLIIAMGTGIGEAFDIEKLRYGKIIIATDADVDGAHIRTLLLTLFYRYFPDLVTNGKIFIAQPPLYKITQGKKAEYCFSDEERDTVVKKFEKTSGAVEVQRYKGLGEMNEDELSSTTMNKENRILKLVTVEDAQEADAVFSVLMGEEVGPRRAFIQSHANIANIDI